jgi:predicted dehydrogenase
MINLGIIGYTDGNGHPYSYSSIFNGYNEKGMKICPFKTIPAYLSKHNSDLERIKHAKITHIWTQDNEISKKIAFASNILNIVDNPSQMIGMVDGVIIARDDYESHLQLARPFIDAGVNVFIDKPIAIKAKAAEDILKLEQFSGQIFSSSSVAYDPRVLEARENLSNLGDIKYIYASAPGVWENYAIHLIDGLMAILGNDIEIENRIYDRDDMITVLNGKLNNKIPTKIACMGGLVSPLRITIVGSKGFFDIDFSDPYHCFKNTLEVFVLSITQKKSMRSHRDIIKSIKLTELP